MAQRKTTGVGKSCSRCGNTQSFDMNVHRRYFLAKSVQKSGVVSKSGRKGKTSYNKMLMEEKKVHKPMNHKQCPAELLEL